MIQASPRHIVGERSWPAGSTDRIPQFDTVPGAAMTVEAAKRAYRAGTVEMATGRGERVEAGRRYIVEWLYAIPRRIPRRGTRPELGRGQVRG